MDGLEFNERLLTLFVTIIICGVFGCKDEQTFYGLDGNSGLCTSGSYHYLCGQGYIQNIDPDQLAVIQSWNCVVEEIARIIQILININTKY